MSTFTVDGVDGISFTAEFDPNANWLTISGHDRDGDLVSKSAFAVTPGVIEDVAVTPESEQPWETQSILSAAAHIESLAPTAEVGDHGSQ
ncbi:hypothetical protein [Rhodococcus qingshengii]|uniref:hypothetical protein n=1 Tax=Rhodococcus qingshengii TaxID=334542 RepID=UPI001BE9BE0E|nr:hypothetical protein [Rhodococcus qingshengii]MBT2272107.1 hypothetical protein [Rhodococcus qingshengii]